MHRSTFADVGYCVIGIASLGAILGWAVVSTSWISDGAATFLTRGLGPAPQLHASDFLLNAARMAALFCYELGFNRSHAEASRSGAVGAS